MYYYIILKLMNIFNLLLKTSVKIIRFELNNNLRFARLFLKIKNGTINPNDLSNKTIFCILLFIKYITIIQGVILTIKTFKIKKYLKILIIIIICNYLLNMC